MADTLYHLGTVAWSNGRNVDALAQHAEAIALCKRHGFTDLVAVQAWHGHGEALLADGRPQAAVVSFETSLHLAREIGERSYEAENLEMIGYARAGMFGTADYGQSLAMAEAALAIAEPSQMTWHVCPTRLLRAYLLGCRGEHEVALDEYAEATGQIERLGLVRYRIMALVMQGELLLELNRHAEAEVLYAQAIVLARDAEVDYWQPRAHAGVAIARLRQQKKVDVDTLEQLTSEASQRHEIYMVVACLGALAEIHLNLGDPDRSEVSSRKLHQLSEAGGMKEQLARAEWLLGRAQAAKGDVPTARKTLETARQMTVKLARPWLLGEIEASLVAL